MMEKKSTEKHEKHLSVMVEKIKKKKKVRLNAAQSTFFTVGRNIAKRVTSIRESKKKGRDYKFDCNS